MKIIKIKVALQTINEGSEVKGVIDVCVEDNATVEQIKAAKENAAREWMLDIVEWSWEDINE